MALKVPSFTTGQAASNIADGILDQTVKDEFRCRRRMPVWPLPSVVQAGGIVLINDAR